MVAVNNYYSRLSPDSSTVNSVVPFPEGHNVNGEGGVCGIDFLPRDAMLARY